MLESPMPFIIGIQIAESDFIQTVYPKMKNNQSNRQILVFLDSKSISPYQFEL